MINNNCTFCGIICEPGKETCKVCSEFANEPSFDSFQQDLVQTEDHTGQTNTYDNGHQNQPEVNHQQAQENKYHSANQGYNYSPPPKHEYERQTTNNPMRVVGGGISSVAKFLVIFVIISLGLAFAVRSFVSSETSKIGQTTNGSIEKPANGKASVETDAEESVPWFSSWFRSNPTGEEIFDKFEKATYAEGNKTVSETFILNGTGYFLPAGFDEAAWAKVYKNRQAHDYYTGAMPNAVEVEDKAEFDELYFKALRGDASLGSGLGNLDMKFIMYLKNPNKMVMSMTMASRFGRKSSPTVKVVAGDEGENTWFVTSGIPQDTSSLSDKQNNELKFGYGRNSKGISMTFPKTIFETIEFKEEVIFIRRKHYKVEVVDSDKSPYYLYFDQETGFASKIESKEMIMYVLNYSLFNDSLIPSKLVHINKDNSSPPMLMEIKSMEMGTPIEDKVFLKSSHE